MAVRGAPIKYRPDMPDELLDMMKNGAKDAWIYAEWGISKATFYRWMNEYPELKEAHDQGLPHCEKFWEAKGVELMNAGDNKAFNYWIAFMNRKFGWSTRNSPGGDTQININNMNVLQHQSPQQLLETVLQRLEDNGITVIDDTQKQPKYQLIRAEDKDTGGTSSDS